MARPHRRGTSAKSCRRCGGVRELATSRFVANAENVLLFGPPGVGKSHLAIALGRAAVEHGHSVLFVTAAALLGALSRAVSDGQLNDKLAFVAKPKARH